MKRLVWPFSGWRRGWVVLPLVALTLFPTVGRGEEAAELELDDFEIIQYVGSAGFSPADLMDLDTNGEILIACREPQTREELRERGITFLESQIVLLRAMRMLRLEEGKLSTQIPFLERARTERLRAATAAAAPRVLEAVREDVEKLAQTLTAQGFGANAYGIVFSYILDGMVWDFFEEYSEVRPRRLSTSRPHWAGEIWGVYPRREFAAGTRSVPSGDLTIKIGWADSADAVLQPLVADWKRLRELLRQVDASGRAEEDSLREELATWGLVSDEGEFAVPVVVEKPGEEIFELSQRVTEKITEFVISDLDLEKLEADLELSGRQQTLIVAYHELMWDLMDALEAEGLVELPTVFADPTGALRPEVAAVAFVVDRRREGAPTGQDPVVGNGQDEGSGDE